MVLDGTLPRVSVGGELVAGALHDGTEAGPAASAVLALVGALEGVPHCHSPLRLQLKSSSAMFATP